ncbi:autotransporter domain-containing protein [Bombella saccharophila]|uniref:Autotransporter domain-containing protein n=1 Tax=Bombella saccharophila TaxID=2967338 RepID=A0ABT3WA42_9PROT|nr:autotransporter domain-containing protein [Bombella saccharophila]MCX5614639.1 autotransporter domain-containing protein [Bombella saccharophila]
MRNKLLFTAALFCVEMTPFGRVYTSARAADAYDAAVTGLDDSGITGVYNANGDLAGGADHPTDAVASQILEREKAGLPTGPNGVQSNFFGRGTAYATDQNNNKLPIVTQSAGLIVGLGSNDTATDKMNILPLKAKAEYDGYTLVRGNGSLILQDGGSINSQGVTEVGNRTVDAAHMIVDRGSSLTLNGDASGQTPNAVIGTLIVGNNDPTPDNLGTVESEGNNNLTVQNGGTVSARTVSIANNVGNNGGVIYVTGDGSQLVAGDGGITVNEGKGIVLVDRSGVIESKGVISFGDVHAVSTTGTAQNSNGNTSDNAYDTVQGNLIVGRRGTLIAGDSNVAANNTVVDGSNGNGLIVHQAKLFDYGRVDGITRSYGQNAVVSSSALHPKEAQFSIIDGTLANRTDSGSDGKQADPLHTNMNIGIAGTATFRATNAAVNSSTPLDPISNKQDATGITVAGNISNYKDTSGNSYTGNLNKTGSGTLTLLGNNTYTGVTTVEDGTLQLGGIVGSATPSTPYDQRLAARLLEENTNGSAQSYKGSDAYNNDLQTAYNQAGKIDPSSAITLGKTGTLNLAWATNTLADTPNNPNHSPNSAARENYRVFSNDISGQGQLLRDTTDGVINESADTLDQANSFTHLTGQTNLTHVDGSPDTALLLRKGNLAVDSYAGKTGSVTITGGGNIVVGSDLGGQKDHTNDKAAMLEDNNRLVVQNGGSITSDGDMTIGDKASGAGAVIVSGKDVTGDLPADKITTGATSSITLKNTGKTGNIVVGNAGTGFLNVDERASVTAGGNLTIGNEAGGYGKVVVGDGRYGLPDTGVTSHLDLTGTGTSGNIIVGQQGYGNLSIQKGGEVTAYGVSVGGTPGSSLNVGAYPPGVATDANALDGGQLTIGKGGLTIGNDKQDQTLYAVGVTHGGTINSEGQVHITRDGFLKVGDGDASFESGKKGTLIAGDLDGNPGILSTSTQANAFTLFGNGVIQNRQGADLHIVSDIYLSDGHYGSDVRRGTFDTNGQNTYVQGNLLDRGQGGIEKTGDGTLYLTGHDSNYTGETLVKQGTLALASDYGVESDANIATSSGLTVADGARLTGYTKQDANDYGAAPVTTVEGGGTIEANWSRPTGTLNVGALNHTGTALTMNGTAGHQSVLSVGVGSAATNNYINLDNATEYSRANGAIDTTGKTVSGRYRQLSGGQIHVNGDAVLNSATINIQGGETGRVFAGDGYRILTATGSVSANHDNALTGDLTNGSLFVAPYLVFENQAVDVLYDRNDRSFESVGQTHNERETGHGLDGLPGSSDIVKAMTGATSGKEARRALNNLSGEIHASARTALIQDSYLIEQAVLDRLSDAGCHGHDGDYVSSQGRYDFYTRRKESRCYSDHAIMWGQAYGSLGHNGGAGNADRLHHQTAGFVMGADAPVGDRWRLGGMIAYGHSMFNTNGASNSSGNSNNISLGAYAGSHWGGFNLRLGAFYTWNLMNMRRHVDVFGFGGRQTSHYRNGTGRAFTELSYTMHAGQFQFEPFLEGAYVNQYAGHFNERGAAALYSQSKNRSVGFTSFGFRTARDFRIGDLRLHAHVMAAYRRAYGSLHSSRQERFYGSANDMDVTGVLLSRDAAVTKAGVSAKVTDRIDLDLSYIGQYGNHSIDSGATGSIKVAF